MVWITGRKVVKAFQKATGYRFSSPARRLRRHVQRKRWSEAERIVLSTGIEIDDWLREHIARCAEMEDAFRRTILPRSRVRERIAGLDAAYSLVSTQRVYRGRINMGAFVHEIRVDGRGGRRRIFEKVLHPKSRPQVELEDLLFREMGHEALLAPEHLGVLSTVGFLSVFYEYKSGGRPSTEARVELSRDAVLKLWCSRPPETLLRVAENLPMVRRDQVTKYLRPEHLDRFLRASTSGEERRLVEDLADRGTATVEAFRAAPPFVLHADMSASNMIRDGDGDCYLVDWDKWCVSHVGAGLELEPGEYLSPTLSERFDEFAGESGEVSPAELWRNVAIDNLSRCLRRGRWNEAIAWTRHVLSRHEDGGAR